MPSAARANLLNVIVILAMSGWAWFAADKQSWTILIPVGFALALLACQGGIKRENKIIAHIAVLLTLIVLVALWTPLSSALERDDTSAVIRAGAMMAASALALAAFIKSFIDNRRARTRP